MNDGGAPAHATLEPQNPAVRRSRSTSDAYQSPKSRKAPKSREAPKSRKASNRLVKLTTGPTRHKSHFFCRTTVPHTLGKHSTRPHDTTRSNLTGSRSRRAARSEGAAQKSVLRRDQQLPVATARIDPAITRLRYPARSARSGDVRGGSRPSDRADQAAKARNGMAQLWMSVEGCAKAADRPVGATEISSVSPRPLTHTHTTQRDQTTRPTAI